MTNPADTFEHALRTASIWNSSWEKVLGYQRALYFSLSVQTQRSPSGLVDTEVAKLCNELKARAPRDVQDILNKFKIKPKKVDPDPHVFLSGGQGGEVLFIYRIEIFATDGDQAAELRSAFETAGAKFTF